MKRLVTTVLLLLMTAQNSPSIAAVEYVRVTGQIQNNPIDPGPNGLVASYSATQNQAEVRSDGTFTIVVPKNTPVTFYLRTSKFYFRNNNPKIFTQDKVMDLAIPQPVKFSGKVVDAQGTGLPGALVTLETNGNLQYKDMTALIEREDSNSIWGITSNTNTRYFADSQGNFIIYSYVTQDFRSFQMFKSEDANGKGYVWRSSPIKGEMPKDFVACVPVNFGSELKLPSFCFEDEGTWRDRVSKELKKQQEIEAELKAKREAESKASTLKRTSIICIKGKLSKKVTAVKPVCPAGYKKK